MRRRTITSPAAPAGESDGRERLLQICEAYVNCARARPAQFRLMFGPLLARKHEFPALKTAAEGAFAQLLAASVALDAERGPELALLGWSLAHGLSNLLIDGAFDTRGARAGQIVSSGIADILVCRRARASVGNGFFVQAPLHMGLASQNAICRYLAFLSR